MDDPTPGTPIVAMFDVITHVKPGSHPQPWTWDDEEADLMAHPCPCCGVPGHRFESIVADIAEHGIREPIDLGNWDWLWDGHHRVLAARRLRIMMIPATDIHESA